MPKNQKTKQTRGKLSKNIPYPSVKKNSWEWEPKTFAANLKREIADSGYTHADFAAMIETNPETLKKWLSGKVNNIPLDSIIKCCVILDCEVEHLLGFQGYEYKNRSELIISKEFGLSDNAVIALREWSNMPPTPQYLVDQGEPVQRNPHLGENYIDILNMLFECRTELEYMLSAAYDYINEGIRIPGPVFDINDDMATRERIADSLFKFAPQLNNYTLEEIKNCFVRIHDIYNKK